MKDFVHLHVHTEYSMLDGMARISEVTRQASKLGMSALAITDHGNMYGAVAFYNACAKANIKAIIGTEFYVCDDLTMHSKNKVDENDEGYKDRRHLVLLAKDDTGYKNLSLLNAIAFRDGFYYKPRIDLKTLKEHSQGLICLSGCIGGDIPQAILSHNDELAEKLVVFFKETFNDDFYLELQNQYLEEQVVVNAKLKYLAKKYGVKTVATNDVHYINKEDAYTHDILLCVQTRRFENDQTRMRMPCNEFYLKTYDEMKEVFPDDEDALQTTLEIANKCNFNFEFGKYKFPSFVPPDGKTPVEYIRELINQGIVEKTAGETKEIRDRIEMELSVIEKQGFIEYYLIVWDYINNARKMGISVGPGRGSGAGSLVAFLIGITDIDPLKYDLYFERFLNSERVSAPDFDIDFEDARRQEVIDYVKNKYGEDSVAKIVTFGTMAAKAVLKDVCKVMNIPFSESNALTKLLPKKVTNNGKTFDLTRPNILAKAFGFYKPSQKEIDDGITSECFKVKELVDLYNDNEQIKKVVDIAIKLEDLPRQASTHACGVIIGHDILDKHMPLSKNKDDITTQYVGSELEKLGFLKMDFLGLRNLSDIKLCIDYVKKIHGKDIVFDRNAYDDAKVYELISTGNTTAIFQIESAGFKNFLSRLKPNCLEDIIAAVSLFRPGPMDSIPTFIRNKHNPEKIVYAHPLLEPILKQTYGCIVYQEQVMRIVQDLAGYTLGQADNVRRMMGKKMIAEMEKEQATFIYGKPESVDKNGKVSKAIDGCVKRGVPENVAKKIWDEMKDFAKYAFNKSHAAAYSVVTYQTAYLKCYYKAEFLTAVLNNRITKSDEIINYVTYAKGENIKVLQPDVNESETYFSVKDGNIRFGLAGIKHVGIGPVDLIIEERTKNGKFTSFEDFCLRCCAFINKKLVESLIYAGAFDSFKIYRSILIAVYEEVLDKASVLNKSKDDNQISIFGMLDQPEKIEVKYPNLNEYDNKTLLSYEKTVAGVYISGHPLANYENLLKQFFFNTSLCQNYEEDEDGEKTYLDITDGETVEMAGIITGVKKISTKSGQTMLAVDIEDMYGTIEGVVFPKLYDKLKDLCVEDCTVRIKGKLQIRDERPPSLVIDEMSLLAEKSQDIEGENEVVKTQYLGLIFNGQSTDEVLDILSAYPGDVKVIFKVDGKNLMASIKVRKCNGLLNELASLFEEKDVMFFEK